MAYRGVQETVWDVVVFGTGWAGFAAAQACHEAGNRTLLVGREGAMLLESGWSFAADLGDSADEAWARWMQQLESRQALIQGEIDGAIAEILASETCRQHGPQVLYFAAPVAAQVEAGRLHAVWVAGKSGTLALSAARWIDATETGELVHVLDPTWQPAKPTAQELSLFCRHAESRSLAELEFAAAELPGARLHSRPSHWPNEQRLSVDLPGNFINPWFAWLPALQCWRETASLGDGVISHGSVIPFHRYDAPVAPRGLPENVIACGAALTGDSTLARRFTRGREAAHALEERSPAPAQPLLPFPELEIPVIECEIAVAGWGTGGALAAVAAARAGGDVLAFDPLPFAGGIGTGGGIHYYYYGIKGGLQSELDQRVRDILPLFGAPKQIRGFHPDAKKIALEEMLHHSRLRRLAGSILWSVRCERDRVMEALITTPEGPRRIRAQAWVDSTGDGDLGFHAGARFTQGRGGDGLSLPYSQSSGFTELRNDRPYMEFVNFGAGYCDPGNIEDLTRARLEGISHYDQQRYELIKRPTYIAPTLGIRQSRHIETELTLGFEDLLLRQRFPDAIGYTGGHYDNHARDFEYESDTAAFWMWVCREFVGHIACEIPYRILVPTQLTNVVMGCRAAGVSEEAHHAFRMQRDMQRLGEAAGLAAALMVRHACANHAVPLMELQQQLRDSGALRLEERPEPSFGDHASIDYMEFTPGKIEEWITALRGGPATSALWHLCRAGEAARPAVEAELDSADPTITWRAGAILAMWGDPRGEARLCAAILNREIGEKEREIKKDWEIFWAFVPRWYAAARFLRRCATPRCLPALESLANDDSVVLNVRTSVAITVETLALGGGLTEAERQRLVKILDQLRATPAPLAIRGPRDSISFAFRESVAVREIQPTDRPKVSEDYRWQLELAVLRARRAFNLPPMETAPQFLADPRFHVRKTFQAELAKFTATPVRISPRKVSVPVP